MTTEIGRRTQGRDWRRAGRAFTTLVRDQQRTDAVFDLVDALGQKDDAEVVRRFSARPEGRRLLEERPNLVSALNAREALRRLPEASLGRAYLDFVEANEISALGLVAADEEREERDVCGRNIRAAPRPHGRRHRCAGCGGSLLPLATVTNW